MTQVENMPITEIATLDYIKGLNREGLWANENEKTSYAFSVLLSRVETNASAIELYQKYDKMRNAEEYKDNLQPQIAILQLNPKEENRNKRFMSMKMLKEAPNAVDYEIIHIRSMETKVVTKERQIELCNTLYAELNGDEMRPINYYGHSLSVGDIVVIADDKWSQVAYFVDSVGFTKLPEDFLNNEMRNKIYTGIDIWKESELYETIKRYEAENVLSLMSEKDIERHFQITGHYLPIFNLADSRGADLRTDELIKGRLFLDLDGTAAEFKHVDTMETLYEKGYFLNLKPNLNVINAIKVLAATHPEIEIYTLSAVLSDSKYALEEKNTWIDKNLAEIDRKHRLFPPCGENKMAYVSERLGAIGPKDCIFDDYTKNLLEWEPPGKGIKALNGINHTRGTWKGNRISIGRKPEDLADTLFRCLTGQAVRENESNFATNKQPIGVEFPER